MSFTRDARDTASSFYYLKALDGLREAYIEKAINGDDLPEDFWERGEAEAVRLTKQEYFCLETRKIFLLSEKADALTDEEDFELRSSELSEMGMYESHRALVRIPWVGHPDFEDPR